MSPLHAEDPRDAWWKSTPLTRGWRGEVLVAVIVWGLAIGGAWFVWHVVLHEQPIGLK